MNVYATQANPYGFGGSRLSPPALSPNGKTLVEGYRKDIITGFEREHPRYNPLNPGRPQSSALVDLQDPIQVHLLTETALSDSKSYEILSQEEVDDLKKQVQSLTQRVESTRANLTIQSKYRDAAISMAKLYSPARLDGKRRSLLSRHSGDIQSAKEAEAERDACERKCEELASELFNLEKRLMEPQRRLLEHTAGILQLTHKASKKKAGPPPGQMINGMPGSPESLYTYNRDSMGHSADDTYFDDPNVYQFDQLDGYPTPSQPRKNAIEIPLKSPIREQANQQRELDRAKDENGKLIHAISEMEQKLEALNGSLRDAIVRFDPETNDEYQEPPFRSGQPVEPIEMLRSQMDYLETGLLAIQAEQESFAGGKDLDQRIEALNRQVRDILLTVDPNYPTAPSASQNDVEGKFAYIEDSLRAVDSELERALEMANTANNASSTRKQDSDQIEVVLMGLWDIIQSGFASIKQQKEERRRARMEKGFEDDENISEDEFDTEEPYTLNGFSTRVQWLYAQATTLKDQKAVLKRQIKQQRELNNKSDAEKDEEIQRKQEELEENRLLLDRAEKDAMDAQKMLSEALEDLEQAREAAASGGAMQAQLREREAAIAALEADIEQLHTNLEAADGVKSQLDERHAKVAALEADVRQLQENLSVAGNAQVEIDERNRKIAALESDIQRLEQNLGAANTSQEELESHKAEVQQRTGKISALEADIKQLQAMLASAEASGRENQSKLNDVDSMIAALNMQLDESERLKTKAEETSATLQKQFNSQKEELAAKAKTLKEKEDELELLNMNMVEMKTELTIAQAELDGAYGSRAERAAEVAAIKNSGEVVKLQNQITRLKNELSGTVKELEDVTKETLAAEREKIELEAKLDEATTAKTTLETEVSSLRERLEGEVAKTREKMAKLQEELDGERLKASPGATGGRPGAGASMLSEQFRATMREERKKFQEDIREERARARKLEEELARLKRAQGPGKSPLSPR